MGKVVLILTLMCLSLFGRAQTLTKEAMNNFARYTQKPELGSLEKAKKNIDEAYKTKRDSQNYRVNLIRALVYSSLAYTDSTRRLKYIKDPLQEAHFSLEHLKNPKLNYVHEGEITFIRQQLSKTWLHKAKKSSALYNYQDAYQAYLWVDSFSVDKFLARHNLAVLSEKLGYTDEAIKYYSYLILDKERSLPDYYLALSALFEQSRNTNKSVAVIASGRKAFPGNKDLLFKEINTFADNGAYDLVAKLVEKAIEFEPDNTRLIYLGGFANEMTGKQERAEEYYKKVIQLEENSYEGNYALGLLYLQSYIKNPTKEVSTINKSRRYLLQAEEINPNSVNVLKSLSLLYSVTKNSNELRRVQNKLNQITLN